MLSLCWIAPCPPFCLNQNLPTLSTILYTANYWVYQILKLSLKQIVILGASLAVQLSKKGAWVQSLVRELNPTCTNEDQRSYMSQIRPSIAKKKKKTTNPTNDTASVISFLLNTTLIASIFESHEDRHCGCSHRVEIFVKVKDLRLPQTHSFNNHLLYLN